MPNITTVPLILLFIFLWRLTGGKILSMVAFVSVFSAASALDFGAMGVAPWLFVLAAGLLLKLITGHRPYHMTPGINRKALCFVLIFLAYASWTSLAYPVMFQGVPVVRTVAEEPLAWGMSNFAQLCYLLAAAVLYLMALGYSRKDLGEVLTWYSRGCVVAALFAMYQLLNATLHVPYPSAVLYSNKAHVIYSAYQINGMWRLNATFSEASEMAGFLIVGFALIGWKLIVLPFRFHRLCSFVLLLFSLLMTMSSVGYLCLAYVAVCGGFLGVRYVVRQGTLSVPKIVFGLLIGLGVAAVFTLQPAARTTVSKVVQSTLLEKQNTDSYRNRTLTHVAAMDTLSRTYYMGAGWGSARASGLFYVLLATVGVPGLLLFFLFLGSLFRPLFQREGFPRRRPGRTGMESADSYGQALFSLSVLLLAMLVAGAEPVDPLLWILFGITTAGREPALARSPRPAGSTPALFPSRVPA